MLIQLKQLYEIVGEKLELDYTVDLEKLDVVKGYSFYGLPSVKGMIYNRAGVLTLTYTVCFTLNSNCDRCLVEFNKDYCFDFEHILVRSLNSDNDEYIVTESDKLDLDELVIMDILLQLPSKMLCKDDCIGLCLHCGTDLNYNECNCNG